MKAPKAAMSLFEAYKEPCTLVWHVSKETAAEINKSELSQDDKETLLACKVLKLSCGDKCHFKVAKEELVSVCVCVCGQNPSHTSSWCPGVTVVSLLLANMTWLVE